MSDVWAQQTLNQVNNLDFDELKRRISGRQVYVWGADQKGCQFAKVLRENDISIVGFLDEKIKEVDGKRVLLPTNIIVPGSSEHQFIFVTMFLKHEDEIEALLKIAGYTTNDYFYLCAEQRYLKDDISVVNSNWYNQKYEEGKKLAEALQPEKIYFLLYGGHIGDEIIALSFLAEYKKKHCIEKIAVITSKLYSGLARLYAHNIDTIIVQEKEELDALRIYSTDRRRSHINIVGASWHWLPQDRLVPFPIAQITFKTIQLGLDYSAKSEYIQGYGYDNITVKDIIEGYGIEQDKSIILIPYAKSAMMLPISFWEGLVSRLSEEYLVYTNVGPGEVEIPGSTPLSVPLEYMVDVARYAGYVISIRCGLMDLLALGQCKGQVLYAISCEQDRNYANVNSRYINGEESVLFTNARYIQVENMLDIELQKCEIEQIITAID